MAHLPWLIRSRSVCVPWKFFRQFKKTNIAGTFGNFLLFHHENVYYVYSLESPHWGDFDEYAHHTITVEPRYLELAYFELPLISKWKSGPCFNMKLWQPGNKIMWKRGEIAPQEQFLLFSALFYIYISNFRSQITYSFVKCGFSIYCFPHSLNSDMSKYGYLEVFQWVPWNSR